MNLQESIRNDLNIISEAVQMYEIKTNVLDDAIVDIDPEAIKADSTKMIPIMVAGWMDDIIKEKAKGEISIFGTQTDFVNMFVDGIQGRIMQQQLEITPDIAQKFKVVLFNLMGQVMKPIASH